MNNDMPYQNVSSKCQENSESLVTFSFFLDTKNVIRMLSLLGGGESG